MRANGGDSLDAVVTSAPNLGTLPEVEAMMGFGTLGFHFTGFSDDNTFAYATRYAGDFVDQLVLVLDPKVAKDKPSGCERHERRNFLWKSAEDKPDPRVLALGTMDEVLRQVEEWPY
jgi:hypothetical protein